jgi:hypothetical protein
MIETLKAAFVNGVGIGLGLGAVLLVARMVSDFVRGLFERDDEEKDEL